jgi:YHS domain-containing protein
MIHVLVKVLQVLFWLLLLRLLVRTVARAFAPRPAPPRAGAPPPPPRVRPPEDLVLDPVCRTYVPRSRALVARVDGREQHFCSEACREGYSRGIPVERIPRDLSV